MLGKNILPPSHFHPFFDSIFLDSIVHSQQIKRLINDTTARGLNLRNIEKTWIDSNLLSSFDRHANIKVNASLSFEWFELKNIWRIFSRDEGKERSSATLQLLSKAIIIRERIIKGGLKMLWASRGSKDIRSRMVNRTMKIVNTLWKGRKVSASGRYWRSVFSRTSEYDHNELATQQFVPRFLLPRVPNTT